MSIAQQKAAVAAIHQSLTNPDTHTVTRVSNYNVSPETTPTFVSFTGTTERYAIQHDTGGDGVGNIPYRVTFHYQRIGNPTGNVSVGIKKASDDSFVLLAEHPVSEPVKAGLITVVVEGSNSYEFVANDKISIEYPPNETDTIELACGTNLPSGFTSQSYDGSYAATAEPLAAKIVSKFLVAI
jgi:hypothetical protein